MAAPRADSALAHLEGLVGLLEQYYHPSNGGRWNSGLAHLFKTLASAFGARLLAESNAARRTAERARGPRGRLRPARRTSGGRGGGGGPGRRSRGRRNASVDGDGASEASEASDDERCRPRVRTVRARTTCCQCRRAGGAAAPLTDVVVERVVGALLRLASKAQFSKVGLHLVWGGGRGKGWGNGPCEGEEDRGSDRWKASFWVTNACLTGAWLTVPSMILHAMLWLSHMGRVLARKPRHVLPSLHDPPHTHTHLQTQQDKELRRSATRILGLLAEVSPRAVLPGVHAHCGGAEDR